MRATIDYAKIDSTSLAAELLLLSPDLQECLKLNHQQISQGNLDFLMT